MAAFKDVILAKEHPLKAVQTNILGTLNLLKITVMRQEVKKDYVSCSVVDITKLGLMEITRKKQEQPLYEIFSEAK